MSTIYKKSEDVPTETIIQRLNELSDAVTKGSDGINREFYMRIPAEVDNDADLVLSEASIRLNRMSVALNEIRNLPGERVDEVYCIARIAIQGE